MYRGRGNALDDLAASADRAAAVEAIRERYGLE
jgi:hypothetical protein